MISLQVLYFVSLTACTSDKRIPIRELSWQASNFKQINYKSKVGDTIYTVAFYYDVDYKQIAAYNNLRMPYVIKPGQILKIKLPTEYNNKKKISLINERRNSNTAKREKIRLTTIHLNKKINQWLRPVSGKVITHYSLPLQKKGIDFEGKKGDKVHASADGIVAYVGDGLVGYSNLVIIKHNEIFLSAYGNNSKILVNEGEKIKAGQVIAEIGSNNKVGLWTLHFEIRKSGKPVNPLNYLNVKVF